MDKGSKPTGADYETQINQTASKRATYLLHQFNFKWKDQGSIYIDLLFSLNLVSKKFAFELVRTDIFL